MAARKVPPVVVVEGDGTRPRMVLITGGTPDDNCPVCKAILRGEDPVKVMEAELLKQARQAEERAQRIQAG